jgi:hypothetical protein
MDSGELDGGYVGMWKVDMWRYGHVDTWIVD